MNLCFSKSIYPKHALIKAAYNYTEKAYIHLGQNENEYIVDIIPKKGYVEPVEKEFINELLIQTVRCEVYDKTKTIRELIVGRAMASTIIDTGTEKIEHEDVDSSEILQDWFGKYE